MIVLVTMRLVTAEAYAEERDALAADWPAFFDGFGVTAVPVPNDDRVVERYLDIPGVRGLVLSGGDSLGLLPGEPGGPGATRRDRTERRLLDGAAARSLGVFGVCRGLQMLTAWYGGRVSRRLPEPHVGFHDAHLEGGWCGADSGPIRVNSFHDEGILRDGLPEELEAFAWTDAGVVEAVRHRHLPIRAVQWHPERPDPAAGLSRRLFQEWLDRCA